MLRRSSRTRPTSWPRNAASCSGRRAASTRSASRPKSSGSICPTMRSVSCSRVSRSSERVSAWHPLWVGGPAHAELGAQLGERALEYLNTEHPTGTLYPDGESAFLTTATDANAAELERHAAGDGEAWHETIANVGAQAELVFGVLGTELWSPSGLSLGGKAYRPSGRRLLPEVSAEVGQSSR